jgi:hypothetical protein
LIHLHEVSLVAVPANPRAQVVTAKSLAQIETVLRSYRPGEVTAADLDQLRSIDAALKALLKKEDCSNPDCEDPNCEGSVKPRQDAEDLKLLKAFAIELKGSTG